MTWYQDQIHTANCHGSVSLYGASLSTPAWAVLNVLSLWNGSEKNQPRRDLPYATETMTFPSRRTGTENTLEMVVVGNVDRDGDAYEDPNIGLEYNIEYLNDEVFDIASSIDNGLLTLTLPSGRTRSAYVGVGRAEYTSAQLPGAALITIPIFIPGGRLGDPVGS